MTFAHGSSDYLQVFDRSVPNAWTLTPGSANNYLFLDIDLLTSDVSFGVTLIEPIVSLIAPLDLVNDQHWFDLNATTMKVWSTSANKWLVRIRLFVGSAARGNSAQISQYDIGSSIGLNVESRPGFIMLDSLLQPLRTSPGEFLTSDTPVRVRNISGTSGVLANPLNAFIPVKAGENIPAMSMVYFSDADTVSLASSNPSFVVPRAPIGLIQESLAQSEMGVLTISGDVSYNQWEWTAHIGKPVYTDSTGQIVASRPEGLLVYRVGVVKNHNTIIFGIDSETEPQVYQSNPNTFILTGDVPITTNDAINGIGERVITVGMDPATEDAPGFMTVQQVLDLINKSDVGHHHTVEDIDDLQAALDLKMDSDISFDDRYALIKHEHDIGNIVNLSETLDSKVTQTTLASSVASLQARTDSAIATLAAHQSMDLSAVRDELQIEAGITRGELDIAIIDRAYVNHTQPISTIVGLQAALDALAGALIISSITGVISTSNLASNGIASSTTFLRGDRTWATQQYDIAVGYAGIATAGDVAIFACNRAFSIAIAAPSSAAIAGAAPTVSTVFTIIRRRAGVNTTMGTVTFNAGQTVGIFSITAVATFITNDLLIINLVTADTTLANVGITFAGAL